MNILYDFNPAQFEVVPPSWELPLEKEQWQQYAEATPNATFISKPQRGCGGEGICLFNQLFQIPAHLRNDIVVQRYIADPLVVDSKKFDLRVYVVVIGINEDNMQAFVADEGLARFCTESYQQPSSENMRNASMHLTNYSLNKLSDEYIEDAKEVLEPNDGTKRTLAALYKQIAKEHGDQAVEAMKEGIKQTCSGALAIILNMFKHHFNP